MPDISSSASASHSMPDRVTQRTARLASFANLSGPTLIVGGTNDPIHLGHTEGARAIQARSGAANVVFTPTRQNPHKKNAPIASDNLRLDLIELAIRDIPNFYVSDMHCRAEVKQTTLALICEIRKEAPHLPLLLAIGADQLPTFHLWDHYEQLFSAAEIWVIGRDSFQAENSFDQLVNLTADQRTALKHRFVPLSMPVSATEIRAALRTKEFSDLSAPQGIDPLKYLHPAVARRIGELGLYK